MIDFNTYIKPIGNNHTLGKILYNNKFYLALINYNGEINPSMIVVVKSFIPYEFGQFALFKFEYSFNNEEIENYENYSLQNTTNFTKGSKMEGMYEC